jgi:hypothetical protein
LGNKTAYRDDRRAFTHLFFVNATIKITTIIFQGNAIIPSLGPESNSQKQEGLEKKVKNIWLI